MPIIDIFICCGIGLGVYKGYKKGLLIEALLLLAFIVSAFIALKLIGVVSPYLENSLGKKRFENILPYLSFLGIFIPSFFIFKQVSFFLKKSIRLTFLGTFDAILGATFGGLTSLFFLSLFFWLIQKMNIVLPQPWTKNSNLYLYTLNFGPDIISFLFEKIKIGGNVFETLKRKTLEITQ